MGFASANDPFFSRLKDEIGPSHVMPQDLLEDAQSVIAYFIPFDQEVIRSNTHGCNASEAWAMTYIETNRLIVHLNHFISKALERQGYRTAVLPPTHHFDEEKLISDWSHKHVAYIAGLGRFGLHHLLITEKGCCGRLGSFVTDAEVRISDRPDSEFCLHKNHQSCKACIEKCANGSLTQDSYDRHLCYEMCLKNAKIYKNEGLADVCGKCSCGVPCSSINPASRLKR